MNNLQTIRQRIREMKQKAAELEAKGYYTSAREFRGIASGLEAGEAELVASLDVIEELRNYIANGQYDSAYDRAEGFLEYHEIACGDTDRDEHKEKVELDLSEGRAA
ncbi:MAG: hypothetical protein QM755_23880 [Luteolibacter sp.]